MHVGIDDGSLSDLRRAAAAFERGLGHVGERVLYPIAARAAELERSTHRYRNRTGMLESTTRAWLRADDGARAEATLVMDRQYAMAVRDLGYTAIDNIAARAADQINAALGDMAERLARG